MSEWFSLSNLSVYNPETGEMTPLSTDGKVSFECPKDEENTVYDLRAACSVTFTIVMDERKWWTMPYTWKRKP